VGNNNDGAIKSLHIVLQPDQSWQVQVIGGLVKHENLRLAENDFRDSDTHAPATRKFFGGLVEVLLRETDTAQNFNSLGLSIVRANSFKTLVNFRESDSLGGLCVTLGFALALAFAFLVVGGGLFLIRRVNNFVQLLQ